MRALCSVGIAVVSACLLLIPSAGAGDPPPVASDADAFWIDKNCLRETKRAWCDTHLISQGWIFKAKSESPAAMKDAYYFTEIFEKAGQTLKCELRSSQGVVAKNTCVLSKSIN